MNLAQTKALLSEFNIQPTRSLGQNFLVDERVVARIGDLADLTPEDLVIEIGPGVGHLTVELASRAGWVIAIEIDHHLLAALSHNLANFGTVTLIHGDALTQNLRQLCQDWPGPVKVVANLPYYVTTDLMLKLMTEVPYCQSLTLMMQKEAAERIMAPVGQQRVQPSWHHRSLQRQIAALRAPLAATARISFSRLSALDTAGAALLTDLIGAQRTLQLAQTEDGLPPASQSLLTTVAQALAQSAADRTAGQAFLGQRRAGTHRRRHAQSARQHHRAAGLHRSHPANTGRQRAAPFALAPDRGRGPDRTDRP